MKGLFFSFGALATSALVAAQVYHNYALVCFDSREVTDICSSFHYQYYCTSRGSVMKRGSGRHTVCDEGCHCVDLNPRRNFLVGLTGQSCYDIAERNIERNLVDVKLQQLTYQHADSVSRDILPLVHSPESEDDKYGDTGFIHVAWNCTLACGNTRDLTAACQRGLDHYYGNSAGDIGNLGQQHIVLEQSYECIDAYSKQARIFGLTWDLIHTITSCNHANIKQNTISKVEVHTPNPEHPGTVLPNSVHSHTKTKAINPLNIRTVNTPVTHAHDYALVCYNDKEITRACQDHKYAYYCTSSGSIAHKGEADSFCDEYCECRDLYPDKPYRLVHWEDVQFAPATREVSDLVDRVGIYWP